MRVLTQPSRWSCLPTAFATAIGISAEEFINRIGHDGSEIVWPELPEPRCRRGFHTQECIRAAWTAGYSVTPVEYSPRLAPGDVPSIEIDNIGFFKACLQVTTGVITGVVGHNGSAKGHAMAYEQGIIVDPTTGTVTKDLPEGFRPTCLWIVKR
jgi:hypothetical protein